MSSIFAETIAKAIQEYRTMLRKYLPQSERMLRLTRLNLKDPKIYESDASLYQTAIAIVEDIEASNNLADDGYYAYSGIAQFAKFLRVYLNKYEIEGEQVIHRTQKASRAIVQAIQLITLPANRLSEGVANQLYRCNKLIGEFGSHEQHELHMGNLTKYKTADEAFFGPVIEHFQQMVAQAQAEEQRQQQEDEDLLMASGG